MTEGLVPGALVGWLSAGLFLRRGTVVAVRRLGADERCGSCWTELCSVQLQVLPVGTRTLHLTCGGRATPVRPHTYPHEKEGAAAAVAGPGP